MQSKPEEVENNTPTGPRSEVGIANDLITEFRIACQQANIESLQLVLQNLSKKDAIALLRSEFPHKSKSWFERNLRYLMSMGPDDFYILFNHQDPTAVTAIRNLSRQNTTHRVSPMRLAFSI